MTKKVNSNFGYWWKRRKISIGHFAMSETAKKLMEAVNGNHPAKRADSPLDFSLFSRL